MALQKYHPFGIRIRRPNYAFDLRALRDLSVLMIFLFTQIISPLGDVKGLPVSGMALFTPLGPAARYPSGKPDGYKSIVISRLILVAQTLLSVFNNISPDFKG